METAPLRIGHICVVECVSAPSVCLLRMNNSPVLADCIAGIVEIANRLGKAQNGRRRSRAEKEKVNERTNEQTCTEVSRC